MTTVALISADRKNELVRLPLMPLDTGVRRVELTLADHKLSCCCEQNEKNNVCYKTPHEILVTKTGYQCEDRNMIAV
jgi:hypothetical protein